MTDKKTSITEHEALEIEGQPIKGAIAMTEADVYRYGLRHRILIANTPPWNYEDEGEEG